MKEFLEYILKLIVDHPDEVIVEEINSLENSIIFTIKANSEDVGKIIGKEGKIIQSLRNITKILAIKENKQFSLEVA